MAKRSTSATSASVNARSSPVRYTLRVPTTRSWASSGTQTNASSSFTVPGTTVLIVSKRLLGTFRVQRLRTTQPVVPLLTDSDSAMISSTHVPSANTGRSDSPPSSTS